MSQHSSQKKETKVVFLNKAQELLTDVNNYVTAQKNYQHDPILMRLIDIVSNGYMFATKANNIKIVSLATYCTRTENFVESLSWFRSLPDYVEVVIGSHELADRRIVSWAVWNEAIIKSITSIRKYDADVIKKYLAPLKLSKTEVKSMLDKFLTDEYMDKLNYRTSVALRTMDELAQSKKTSKDLKELADKCLRDWSMLTSKAKQLERIEQKEQEVFDKPLKPKKKKAKKEDSEDEDDTQNQNDQQEDQQDKDDKQDNKNN